MVSICWVVDLWLQLLGSLEVYLCGTGRLSRYSFLLWFRRKYTSTSNVVANMRLVIIRAPIIGSIVVFLL